MLGVVCSFANYIASYEEIYYNRVSNFQYFVFFVVKGNP